MDLGCVYPSDRERQAVASVILDGIKPTPRPIELVRVIPKED